MDVQEDWEEWDPTKTTFATHAIAGSIAGVMEHTAMYPFDTFRTLQQADRSRSFNSTFRALVHESGLRRMWRGVPAVAIGCIPSHAAYFSVYEWSKRAFGVHEPGHHPLAAAGVGAASTMLHDMILTPIDTVKQRLQLGYYNGAMGCIRQVLAQEGVVAFFRSYPTTVAMNIPYAATVVTSNETLRKILNPNGDHSFAELLVCGGASGAIGGAVTNPLDVIKTRLQTQQLEAQIVPSASSCASSVPPSAASASPAGVKAHMNGGRLQVATIYTKAQVPEYKGFWDVAVRVYKTEGMSAFFKGVRPRMMVHAPSMAISWSTYELAKRALA